MNKKIYSLFIIVPIFIGLLSIPTNTALGQFGESPISSSKGVQATYIVDIVAGAAEKNSTINYYPKNIAIPIGTTIAFFNDDPGQPHTVTSGSPKSPDSGKEFNSGIIPYTSFFLHTFDKDGLYQYYDTVNPSLEGTVYVSPASELGYDFKISAGMGLKSNDTQSTWEFDKSKNDRVLINFEPTTVKVDDTTPLTYQISIFKDDTPVFSKSFFSLGNVFQIELVSSEGNQTSVYGPDFTDPITGAYHILIPLPDGDYTLRAEINAIGSKVPEQEIFDEFKVKVIS